MKPLIIIAVIIICLPMVMADYYEDFETGTTTLMPTEDIADIVVGSLLEGVYSLNFDTTGSKFSFWYGIPHGSLTPGEPITVSFWISVLQGGGDTVITGVVVSDQLGNSTGSVFPGIGCGDCIGAGYMDAAGVYGEYFYYRIGDAEYILYSGVGAVGNDFFIEYTMYSNNNVTFRIYDDGMNLLNTATAVQARGSTFGVYLADAGTDASLSNVLFDNIQISSAPPCTPDWFCDGYEECIAPLINASCDSVVDNNTCGESYTGDYSEFTPEACVYAPPTGAVVGGGEAATEYLVTLFAMLLLIGLVMAVVPMKSLSDQMKKIVIGSALAFTIVIILVVIL